VRATRARGRAGAVLLVGGAGNDRYYVDTSDFIAESNIVDRHIRVLRAKLQNDWRKPRYIATVPGRGYKFVATSEGEGSAVH